MPKADVVRRIDNTTQKITGSAGATVVMMPGDADTVNGFHASAVPRANTLLALDENGVFPASALPSANYNGGLATGHHGVQYIGPSTYLGKRLLVDDTQMLVVAPIFSGDESVILSHYSTPQEYIWIVGSGVQDGDYWRYPIARAKRSSTAQEFPAWTEVISMGSPASGGHIMMVSADSDSGPGNSHLLPEDITDSPYIQMRQNNDDASRSTSWKLQLGRLKNIPDRVKEKFPDITDWDRFGLAAEDIFAIGGIYALYGSIAGTLDVTGKLIVKSDENNSRLEFGDTVAGWGQVMRDAHGNPVIMMITPYRDVDGNESDVAFILQNAKGEKSFYWHFDESDGDWKLEAGGFTLTETSMMSGDFGFIPSDREIQFASGYSMKAVYDFVLDDIALHLDGFYMLKMGAGSEIYAQDIMVNGNARFDYNLNLTYAMASSSKDPTSDAPDTWIALQKNGDTYYVPAYAA